ncbi:MAG: hypothetical protein ABII20_01880, partial [Candidatus Omnitrophota bacterium]
MKKNKLKLRRGVGILFFLLFTVCAVFSGVTLQGVVRDIFNYRLDQAREQIGALKAEEKSYARALYFMHKGLYGEAHDEMSKSGAPADDRWKEYISAMKEIGAGFESE